MNDRSDLRAKADAVQALALLRDQSDALRANLMDLRLELANVQQEIDDSRIAQLQHANEKLVLAALSAETIAETAASNLVNLTRSSERDALTHEAERAILTRRLTLAASNPDNGMIGLQSSGADLREANEHLVLAVLGAQKLEGHAQDAHRQQIKFMAVVAHELRNPLTPIRLASSLLVEQDFKDKPALARLQAIIDNQVVHLSRLIDDLLDGSRVSTGKLRLEKGPVEVVSLLDGAIETCRPVIETRNQILVRSVPSGPIHFHGDAIRLTQIFSNLLDNASKYTPESGVITLSLERLDCALRITVADNGIGISAEALPHVFDLFVQDKLGLTHARGGLGIGLAVVRDLVEAHGGTVTGSSPGEGLGSEFCIKLPCPNVGTADLEAA